MDYCDIEWFALIPSGLYDKDEVLVVIRTRIQDFTDGWQMRKENGPSINIVNHYSKKENSKENVIIAPVSVCSI